MDICTIEDDNGSFSWCTDYYHQDNAFTMTDFLENRLDGGDIIEEDGSYAEVEYNGLKYALYASGNGDSFNHVVEWERL